MRKTLAVVLPAYNEADNIPRLTQRWQKQAESLALRGAELEILIVDDGSGDATRIVGDAQVRAYPNVRLLAHPVNKGLGEALKTGLSFALDSMDDCPWVVVMDCDNTHDPAYILPMIDAMDGSEDTDVVIASRYRKGSEVHGVPFYRFFVSYGARFVYTLSLHIRNVRDYTCGYRLYRTASLRAVRDRFGEEWIRETGFACMVELLYKLYLTGARMKEVPFSLRYDEKLGDSKMQVARTTSRSLALIRKLRKIRMG